MGEPHWPIRAGQALLPTERILSKRATEIDIALEEITDWEALELLRYDGDNTVREFAEDIAEYTYKDKSQHELAPSDFIMGYASAAYILETAGIRRSFHLMDPWSLVGGQEAYTSGKQACQMVIRAVMAYHHQTPEHVQSVLKRLMNQTEDYLKTPELACLGFMTCLAVADYDINREVSRIAGVLDEWKFDAVDPQPPLSKQEINRVEKNGIDQELETFFAGGAQEGQQNGVDGIQGS